MLGLVLLVAAAFRLYGLETWDSDSHQHPDERFLTIVASKVSMPSTIAEYFNSQRSGLSPYVRGEERYAYGQLPLTLTRMVAEWTDRATYEQVYGVGRALSALADLGTIVFAWLLARRVFGVRTAHLAALLLALTVLHVQLAHYFAVDTFVAFFAAAALFFAQRTFQRETLLDAMFAGLLAGLAAACKVSAVTLLPVLGLAMVWPRHGRPVRSQFLDGLTAFGVCLVAAFFAFRIAEPYAFLGPAPWGLRLDPQWLTDKAYQIEVSSGRIDVPFMIQWAGTPAIAFVLQNMVQWGMGPALGIASLFGLALASWRLLRGHPREGEALLVIIWAFVNLLYFGGQFAKFMRYMLPAYFALVMLAAYGLLQATEWLGQMRLARVRPVARLLAPAVVGATALWAFAFSNGIYAQPHSRIQASDWIYAHIPAGATLATEHWDDRLPLARPDQDAGRYRFAELALYDPENQAKRTRLLSVLDQSQYIIMSSRRLADSIPRLPERYPLATTYYRLLQSGQLGFEPIAHFQVEPRVGARAIDDSRAQEDFTVYDHPLVEIWAKRADYSSESVRRQLNAVPLDRVVNVRPIDGGKGALLQSAAEQQAQANAGTWSQLFNREDLANHLPLLFWLVALEALALSAVPMLWRVLPFLGDRGFGASKILALAFIGYVSWLIASFKLVTFERPLIALAWLLLVAASFAAIWDREQRATFVAWLRRERRLLWVTECVFLAAFILFLFIRAANPDLWHPIFGGEKPMNFAYLNAVTKSVYFPPYDPWFAGGIINYYYFGFVLVAVPIKLTGILPEVAFNLAEPTLFGALCAGMFGLAFTLSVPARATVGRGLAYLAGLSAVLLVGVLGNLDAGLQVFDQLWKLGGELAPQSGGVARLLAGVLAVIQGAHFPMLDFWRSTRFIGPEDAAPIHEFPYFTFLYGDLHAHQIALPLTVAALLVGLSVMRSLRSDPTRVPWPGLAMAGLLVAMLRATNTWDFPTYAAVVGLMLVLGSVHGVLRLDRRATQTLIISLGVFAIFLLLSFAPYLERYQLFYTGVDQVKARTALSQFLTIHGLFLFLGASLFVSYFVRTWRVAAARRSTRLVAEPSYYSVLLPVTGWGQFPSPAGLAAGAGLALGVIFVLSGYVTRGFIVLGIGVAVAACLAHWRHADRALQAALFTVALFATLIPEFLALQGDVGRMNTVFKFYLQAWVLLSLVAAVAVGWLWRRSESERVLRQVRPAWVALAAIFVLASLAYPLLATKAKVALRFADLPLSLDGMQYMDFAQYRDDGRDLNLPGDAMAIRWLQDNVEGTPVILEGRAPVYRWGSRMSIYTGLPTLLGWDVHQGQQRAGYAGMLQERMHDVERAYVSADPRETMAVLRKYQVRYVVVGGLERAYYPQAGLEKFRAMPELALAYDARGVQIFEVQP